MKKALLGSLLSALALAPLSGQSAPVHARASLVQGAYIHIYQFDGSGSGISGSITITRGSYTDGNGNPVVYFTGFGSFDRISSSGSAHYDLPTQPVQPTDVSGDPAGNSFHISTALVDSQTHTWHSFDADNTDPAWMYLYPPCETDICAEVSVENSPSPGIAIAAHPGFLALRTGYATSGTFDGVTFAPGSHGGTFYYSLSAAGGNDLLP